VYDHEIYLPPILRGKQVRNQSVFQPEALLREARRQKQLPEQPVPAVCILDPDGDIVRFLRKSGRARPFDAWPCYHTDLDAFDLGERTLGIIGRVVGAPFAVLVAEELFAGGCRLLISLTSAGQIIDLGSPPYFVVIDRALRDEGTSYHYLPPGDFSEAAAVESAISTLTRHRISVHRGASWTTDAPFRETAEAVAAAKAKGMLAVEMEAAALYAFASARNASVLCLAHVTNTMAQTECDFEKGREDGVHDALVVLELVIAALDRNDRETR
jgi:uridine phosphorylase